MSTIVLSECPYWRFHHNEFECRKTGFFSFDKTYVLAIVQCALAWSEPEMCFVPIVVVVVSNVLST